MDVTVVELATSLDPDAMIVPTEYIRSMALYIRTYFAINISLKIC